MLYYSAIADKCNVGNATFIIAGHEAEILSELEYTWDRHFAHFCRASTRCKRSLNDKLKRMFASCDHSKPLHIKTQSMFIRVWANVNIKYALNYLIMDGYCTQINVHSIVVLLKVMSIIGNSAYYLPLIKQIWNVILQNSVILNAMLNHSSRNIASYSMLTLAVHDAQLNTIMSILNAAKGTRQIFKQKSLTAVLNRLNDARDKSLYKWAVLALWNRSIPNVFHPLFPPEYRRDFVRLMEEICDLYEFPELKQHVLMKNREACEK